MQIVIDLISNSLKLSMYTLFLIVILLFVFLITSSNKIVGGNICLTCFIIVIYFIIYDNYIKKDNNIKKKNIIYSNNDKNKYIYSP